MRVLFVTQEMPPDTAWGGIGTYAGIIAPALARAGADVHVLSVVADQERRTQSWNGVTIHRAPLDRERFRRLPRLPHTERRLTLARAVDREFDRLDLDVDVVESPEWGAEGLRLRRRLARRGVPLVVRLHSGAAQIFPHIGPLTIDQRLAVHLEHRLVRHADLVTGTHAQVVSVPPALGVDPERVVEITYPVDPADSLPPPSRPGILMAGRLEHRKGPATLVDALPAVLERIPDARLLLLGTDTSDDRTPSYVRMLTDRARALGVDHALEIDQTWGPGTVRAALSDAAVCAVPSRWESFGYVAAEAAMAARPVVGSRIPALAALVDDGATGHLVDPEDPAAWADAIARRLEDPARTTDMGQAARERVLRHCHPDRVAERTLDAYDRARRAGRICAAAGTPA